MESVRHLRRRLQWTADRLRRHGIENPRAEAEWILAHALRMRRLDLYLKGGQQLTADESRRIEEIVARRIGHEPLQYILGTVDFCGLQLAVNSDVLIPRPETEEMVDWIRRKIGPRLEANPAARILDLGTGSGAIILALGNIFPSSSLLASDASAAALTIAEENYRANGLKNPIRFIQSDWFENIEGSFDLIVSNPPYLTDGEWATAAPEIRLHEPKSALVAAENGLSDLRTIISLAPDYLKNSGALVLEIGLGQAKALLEFARKIGFSNGEILMDALHRERFLFLSTGPL